MILAIPDRPSIALLYVVLKHYYGTSYIGWHVDEPDEGVCAMKPAMARQSFRRLGLPRLAGITTLGPGEESSSAPLVMIRPAVRQLK